MGLDRTVSPQRQPKTDPPARGAPEELRRPHSSEGPPASTRYFVYILRCGDGTLYTGVTGDVERRLAAHRAGKGAKYTRGRGPLTLLYQEACADKSSALKREIAIKRLTREEKLKLIKEAENGTQPYLG